MNYGLHIVLSANICGDSDNFERLDTVFVKDEYKNEVITTTDDTRATNIDIVHDALR